MPAFAGENMRSLNSTDDDNEDDAKSMFYWWRSAGEFDEGGRIKIDNISTLTPRLKILRELERLALVAADSLDDLRHKLVSYRSGDFWLPVGGIRKEDLDIPPIITILLVGFSGSGKSSLVNLMYSVLGRSSLIPFAQTSGNPCNHTTMYMEEHNVLRSMRSGFCVYDSRGLDYKRKTESLEGLKEWVENGIHHHQLCSLPSDDVGLDLPTYSSSKFVQRRVNCTVVVANVAEIYRALMAGDSMPLEATRDLFNSPAISNFNENPMLILTHGDVLSTEERLDGRQKICQFLGVSETTGAYDIACITEHGFLADESDPMTAYALTEAVYRALLFADRTHPPKKSVKDRLFQWSSWIMCAIAAFFAFLAQCFSKMGKKERKHKVY